MAAMYLKLAPMVHFLRMALNVFITILMLALCVLWVRSYDHYDSVLWHCCRKYGVGGGSISGRLIFGRVPADDVSLNDWHWWASSERSDWRGESVRQEKDFNGAGGFGAFCESNYYLLMLPHWVLILLTGIGAAGLWIGRQFSRHTLLVVMTLFAGVMGMFGLMVMMKG